MEPPGHCHLIGVILPDTFTYFVETGPTIFFKIVQYVVYNVFEPHKKLSDD